MRTLALVVVHLTIFALLNSRVPLVGATSNPFAPASEAPPPVLVAKWTQNYTNLEKAPVQFAVDYDNDWLFIPYAAQGTASPDDDVEIRRIDPTSGEIVWRAPSRCPIVPFHYHFGVVKNESSLFQLIAFDKKVVEICVNQSFLIDGATGALLHKVQYPDKYFLPGYGVENKRQQLAAKLLGKSAIGVALVNHVVTKVPVTPIIVVMDFSKTTATSAAPTIVPRTCEGNNNEYNNTFTAWNFFRIGDLEDEELSFAFICPNYVAAYTVSAFNDPSKNATEAPTWNYTLSDSGIDTFHAEYALMPPSTKTNNKTHILIAFSARSPRVNHVTMLEATTGVLVFDEIFTQPGSKGWGSNWNWKTSLLPSGFDQHPVWVLLAPGYIVVANLTLTNEPARRLAFSLKNNVGFDTTSILQIDQSLWAIVPGPRSSFKVNLLTAETTALSFPRYATSIRAPFVLFPVPKNVLNNKNGGLQLLVSKVGYTLFNTTGDWSTISYVFFETTYATRPLVNDHSKVLIGTSDSTIGLLDLSLPAAWSMAGTNLVPPPTPSANEGVVFLTGTSSDISAIDLKRHGKQLWTSSAARTMGRVDTIAAVGKQYIASVSYTTIYVVSALDGTYKTKLLVNRACQDPTLPDVKYIAGSSTGGYFVAGTRCVYRVTPALTLESVQIFKTSQRSSTIPVIDEENHLIYFTQGASVYAALPDPLQLQWTHVSQYLVKSAVGVGPFTIVLSAQEIICLNAASGVQLWAVSLAVQAKVVLPLGDSIIVATTDGCIAKVLMDPAIDQSASRIVWQHCVNDANPSPTASNLVSTPDGGIYVAFESTIYCVNFTTGSSIWQQGFINGGQTQSNNKPVNLAIDPATYTLFVDGAGANAFDAVTGATLYSIPSAGISSVRVVAGTLLAVNSKNLVAIGLNIPDVQRTGGRGIPPAIAMPSLPPTTLPPHYAPPTAHPISPTQYPNSTDAVINTPFYQNGFSNFTGQLTTTAIDNRGNVFVMTSSGTAVMLYKYPLDAPALADAGKATFASTLFSVSTTNCAGSMSYFQPSESSPREVVVGVDCNSNYFIVDAQTGRPVKWQNPTDDFMLLSGPMDSGMFFTISADISNLNARNASSGDVLFTVDISGVSLVSPVLSFSSGEIGTALLLDDDGARVLFEMQNGTVIEKTKSSTEQCIAIQPALSMNSIDNTKRIMLCNVSGSTSKSIVSIDYKTGVWSKIRTVTDCAAPAAKLLELEYQGKQMTSLAVVCPKKIMFLAGSDPEFTPIFTLETNQVGSDVTSFRFPLQCKDDILFVFSIGSRGPQVPTLSKLSLKKVIPELIYSTAAPTSLVDSFGTSPTMHVLPIDTAHLPATTHKAYFVVLDACTMLVDDTARKMVWSAVNGNTVPTVPSQPIRVLSATVVSKDIFRNNAAIAVTLNGNTNVASRTFLTGDLSGLSQGWVRKSDFAPILFITKQNTVSQDVLITSDGVVARVTPENELKWTSAVVPTNSENTMLQVFSTAGYVLIFGRFAISKLDGESGAVISTFSYPACQRNPVPWAHSEILAYRLEAALNSVLLFANKCAMVLEVEADSIYSINMQTSYHSPNNAVYQRDNIIVSQPYRNDVQVFDWTKGTAASLWYIDHDGILIVSDHFVFTVENSWTVRCYDILNGEKLWELYMSAYVNALNYNNGVLLVATHKQLVRLSTDVVLPNNSTNRHLWETNWPVFTSAPESVPGMSIVFTNHDVAIVSSSLMTSGVNVSSGEIVWHTASLSLCGEGLSKQDNSIPTRSVVEVDSTTNTVWLQCDSVVQLNPFSGEVLLRADSESALRTLAGTLLAEVEPTNNYIDNLLASQPIPQLIKPTTPAGPPLQPRIKQQTRPPGYYRLPSPPSTPIVPLTNWTKTSMSPYTHLAPFYDTVSSSSITPDHKVAIVFSLNKRVGTSTFSSIDVATGDVIKSDHGFPCDFFGPFAINNELSGVSGVSCDKNGNEETFYAFYNTNLSVAWTKQYGSSPSPVLFDKLDGFQNYDHRNPVSVSNDDGSVACILFSDAARCISTKSGDVLSTTPLQSKTWMSPVFISGKFILSAAQTGAISAVSGDGKTILWRKEWSPPQVGKCRSAVVVDQSYAMRCVAKQNATTGNLSYEFIFFNLETGAGRSVKVDDEFTNPLSSYYFRGDVLMVANAARAGVYSIHNGELLFSTPPIYSSTAVPLFADENLVYICAGATSMYNTQLIAFNISSGQQEFSVDTGMKLPVVHQAGSPVWGGSSPANVVPTSKYFVMHSRFAEKETSNDVEKSCLVDVNRQKIAFCFTNIMTYTSDKSGKAMPLVPPSYTHEANCLMFMDKYGDGFCHQLTLDAWSYSPPGNNFVVDPLSGNTILNDFSGNGSTYCVTPSGETKWRAASYTERGFSVRQFILDAGDGEGTTLLFLSSMNAAIQSMSTGDLLASAEFLHCAYNDYDVPMYAIQVGNSRAYSGKGSACVTVVRYDAPHLETFAIPTLHTITTPFALSNKCVVALDALGHLLCFRKDINSSVVSEALHWSTPLQFPGNPWRYMSVTVFGNQIFASINSYIFCVDEATGTIRWKLNFPGGVDFMVGYDTHLIIMSQLEVSWIALAVQGVSQRVVKSIQCTGGSSNTPSTFMGSDITPQGILFFVNSGELYTVDLKNQVQLKVSNLPPSACTSVQYSSKAERVVAACGTVVFFHPGTAEPLEALTTTDTIDSVKVVNRSYMVVSGANTGVQGTIMRLRNVPISAPHPTAPPPSAPLPPGYQPQGVPTAAPTLPPDATIPSIECIGATEQGYTSFIQCANSAVNEAWAGAANNGWKANCHGAAAAIQECHRAFAARLPPVNCGSGYIKLQQLLSAVNNSRSFAFSAHPERCRDGAGAVKGFHAAVTVAKNSQYTPGDTLPPSFTFPAPANGDVKFTGEVPLPPNTTAPTMSPTTAPTTAPPTTKPSELIEFVCDMGHGSSLNRSVFELHLKQLLNMSSVPQIKYVDVSRNAEEFTFIMIGPNATQNTEALQHALTKDPEHVKATLHLASIKSHGAAPPQTEAPEHHHKTDKSNGKKKLSGGLISAIVICVLVLVGAVMFLLYKVLGNQKRDAAHDGYTSLTEDPTSKKMREVV